MENYENVENNTLVAYNMSNTTNATVATTRQAQGIEGQDLQVVRQLRLKIKKNHLETLGVFRITSKNAGK